MDGRKRGIWEGGKGGEIAIDQIGRDLSVALDEDGISTAVQRPKTRDRLEQHVDPLFKLSLVEQDI